MAFFSPQKCLKIIIVAAFMLIISVNLYYFKIFSQSNDQSELNFIQEIDGVARQSEPRYQPQTKMGDLKVRPQSPNNLSNIDERRLKEDDPVRRIEEFNQSLRFIIENLNSRQIIRNIDRYPPNSDYIYQFVLVVQVHNRDQYLRSLVASLRTVAGINDTLLVLSHDFYSKEIFTVVDEIDFMPVVQIFYPMAMQLFRDKFPGADPKDCPRDMKREEALRIKCLNADHPDLYGHYREAPFSQTKLHWFWKLHHVFEELHIMKNYNGFVVLLEEDHYVTPDLIHMLKLLVKSQPQLCPQCKILTLGNYDKKPSYDWTSEAVLSPDFISSKHNMAMSINRETFNAIRTYKDAFCAYDDYNWDWSLQYLGQDHIPGKLPTLILKTPRVFHIGECGVHHKGDGKKCDPEQNINPINNLVKANSHRLFPSQITLGGPNTATLVNYRKAKPNGGWGDKRDQDLCASFMSG